MSHIFISYSRSDADIMQQMRAALQDEGCAAWTDEELSRGSDNWQQAIEAAIESARCLVVLLSAPAKNSAWVRRELSYAEAQDVPIRPILVRDDVKTAVPAIVINHQRWDIRSEDPEKLAANIKKQARKICESCGKP